MLNVTNLIGFAVNRSPIEITNISTIANAIATSATFTNVSLGPAYTGRLLIICISFNNNANFRTQNSCTVNGVAATRVGQYTVGTGTVTGVTIYRFNLNTGTTATIVSNASGNLAHTMQCFSVSNAVSVEAFNGLAATTLTTTLGGEYKNRVIGVATRVYAAGITATWSANLTTTGYTSNSADNWTLTGTGTKTTSDLQTYTATFSTGSTRSALMLVSIN